MHPYLWLFAGLFLTCKVLAESPAANIWTGRKDVPLEQNLFEVFGLKPTRTEVPADGVVVFPKLEEHALGRWCVWLKVPETGDYRFFVASDDTMGMWLSSDETLAQAKMISFNRTATDAKQWIRHPSQQSAPVRLEKGKKYALLLAWCNYGGPGHAALGWQPPGADAPATVPLANPDGSPLFEPYQAPPSDSDNDMLPDEWERANGLKVDPDSAEMSGWGDLDGDSVSNHDEYLKGTNPNKAESYAGLVTLDGGVEVPQLNRDAYYTMPEEMFWLPTEAPFKLETRTLDKLGGEPRDRSVVRVRALITAPVEGYYNFCSTATGRHTTFVSDDATPHAVNTRFSQLHYTFGNFDGPPIYLKKDEVRYFELRQVNTGGPRAIGLAWRMPDGTTQSIPKDCVRNYLPADDDPDPGAMTPDGRFTALLKTISPGDPIELDLDKAEALTNGWAAFSGHNQKRFIKIDPAPDFTQSGLSAACGGSLEFEFETPASGYAVLAAQIQLCSKRLENVRSDCEWEINGVRFGWETLWARNGSAPVFRCVTPWLEAGRHKLRLHFIPPPLMGAVRIFSVVVHPITDTDDTAAVRDYFSKRNTIMPARGDGDFLRSPACVEIQTASSSAPVLTTNGRKIAVQAGLTDTWWADVPLPENGEALDLTVSSSAYQVESVAAARWAETRVAEHPIIHLRQGDALRVTARPPEAEDDSAAQAVVVFRGRELPTPFGKPVICRFDKSGDEIVMARFTPEGGEPMVSEMTVRVLPRWQEVIEAGVVQQDRTSHLRGSSFIPGVWMDGGGELNIHAIPSGDGNKATEWRCTARRVGRLAAVARAGRHGPILGRVLADGVNAWPQWDNFSIKSKDGTNTDYGYVSWMVTGLPSGWSIRTSFTGVPDWALYHPDPNQKAESVIYPWRYGAIALGQFWIKANGPMVKFPQIPIEFVPPKKGEKH